VSDGTTAWEERTYPGSVVLVDGQLVALSITAGVLRVVEATPPPSVVGRRIFVRNDEEVAAVDVE
jgi:hypothetical protein